MKITVYTISDCKFSKQEKDYLKNHNLPFEEKNLEKNKEFLTEMLAVSNNFAGTPVTKVDKDNGESVVLKGFTQSEFDSALGLSGHDGASDQPSDQPAPTPPAPQPEPEPVTPPVSEPTVLPDPVEPPQHQPAEPKVEEPAAPAPEAPAETQSVAVQDDNQNPTPQPPAPQPEPTPAPAPETPAEPTPAPVEEPKPVEPPVNEPVQQPQTPPAETPPAPPAQNVADNDPLASILKQLQSKSETQNTGQSQAAASQPANQSAPQIPDFPH